MYNLYKLVYRLNYELLNDLFQLPIIKVLQKSP